MDISKFKQNLIFLILIFFCSCATLESDSLISSAEEEIVTYLPKTFTDENVLVTHIGMSSDEVIKMYGDPKNISQSVCGGATTGGTWQCTTWEYGKSPYDNATFTFAEREGARVINSFDIERKKSDLPEEFTTENIMKVQQGISHSEIYELFGPPRNVSQAICGAATPQPWVCITWEYGNAPYPNASFTFSLGKDSITLNDFKVERD